MTKTQFLNSWIWVDVVLQIFWRNKQCCFFCPRGSGNKDGWLSKISCSYSLIFSWHRQGFSGSCYTIMETVLNSRKSCVRGRGIVRQKISHFVSNIERRHIEISNIFLKILNRMWGISQKGTLNHIIPLYLLPNVADYIFLKL